MLYQKYNHIRQINYTPSLFIFAILLFLMQITVPAAMAQEGDQEAKSSQFNYEQALKNTPEGLSFAIRFKDGKTEFRRGETISIDLIFSSRVPRTYAVSNRSYDRSGRLGIDTYHLSPKESVADPLYDYFHAPLGGFIGGGIYSSRFLEEKPFVITQDLNEWYRFDQPGKYKLFVSTNRVSKKNGPDPGLSGTDIPMVSNVLEFEILPDDQSWSERSLFIALLGIDFVDQTVDQKSCRAIRFMVSADATRAMIKRFKGESRECDGEFYFGLIGSPHRKLVIDEMEKQLAAPDHPVSSNFLFLLTLLSFTHQSQMPPSPSTDASQEELATYQSIIEKLGSEYNEAQIGYVKKLISIIPKKNGRAKTVTISTVFSNLARFPSANFRDLAVPISNLHEEFATNFLDMPPDQQYSWLIYNWNRIATPSILPALHSIYKNPPSISDPIRDAALQRIYEIAPEQGRRLILEEIRSPKPKVSIKALGMLHDISLPEMNGVLAENFEKSEEIETISFLIERYATSEAMPRILAASEEKIGEMACATQSALLAYFLRIDSQKGSELIKQALASRENTGCYRSLLSDVAPLHMTSELEQIAISALYDPDLETARQTTMMLQRYGSPAAEEHLWRRLEQWNEQWLSKKADGAVLPSESEYNGIEQGLSHALRNSEAWVAGPDKLQKIYSLCHTKNECEEVKRLIDGWNTLISVNIDQSGENIISANVAHYSLNSLDELKKKLAQFPAGTSFTFESSNPDSEKEKEIFDELKSFLSNIGVKLERKKS